MTTVRFDMVEGSAADPEIEVSPFERLLHLLALSSFAVAQPLLDLVSKNVSFLIYHGAGKREVWLLAGGLLFALPVLLWLIELAGGKLAHALRRTIAGGFTAFLLFFFALLVLKKLGVSRAAFLLPFSFVFAVFSSWLYSRSKNVRLFLAILSPSVLVFSGTFLLNASIESVLEPRPADDSPSARLPSPEPGPVSNVPELGSARPSVVVVVFDALPLVSLLDREHGIDPVLYPNIADLASRSTWFRNASTIWSHTECALPAIVTGRSDVCADSPTYAKYPRNLFSLLGETHDLRIHEVTSRFAPPGVALEEAAPRSGAGASGSEPARPADSSGLLADIFIIYLHMLAPADLSHRIPPVDQTIGGFLGARADRFGVRTRIGEGIEKRQTGELVFLDHRGRRFEQFVDAVRSPSTIYFHHTMLPHVPLRFLPSGKIYGLRPITLLPPAKAWLEDEIFAFEIYQRHLLQLRYVDRLVGELVSRLEDRGLYDPFALVITSDHGVSYWFGQQRRHAAETAHPQDILRIPLIIKRPFQKSGTIDDRNVQTTDLLPTIAELAGVEVPWETEGISAFDDTEAPPAEKVLRDPESPPLVFPGHWHLDEESLERKLALFDPRWGPERLYRVGPFRELVGSAVEELPVAGAAPCQVDFDQKEHLESYQPGDDGYLPSRLSGRIACEGMNGEDIALVLALHGTIGAVPVVPLDAQGMGIFAGFVSEELVSAGHNPVDMLLADGNPDRRRFRRVTIR